MRTTESFGIHFILSKLKSIQCTGLNKTHSAFKLCQSFAKNKNGLYLNN